MGKSYEGQCTVCRRTEEVRHFALYVTGSEGTELCQSCQVAVSHIIQVMIGTSLNAQEAAIKSLYKESEK